ncbi:hypothetical protein FOMPIDRAFT_1087777, partial [Fomitopsis schrenkii]
VLALGLCASSAGFSGSNSTTNSYVVKIKRRPSGRLSSRDGEDTHVFDPTYATAEIQGLLGKYAQAEQFLSGIGLNPDTHPGKGYEPFTHPLLPMLNNTANGTMTNTSGTANTATTRPAPNTNTTQQQIIQVPGTEEMPLTDDIASGMDVLYYGSLAFGSNKQSLTVDIDTGSADLWVPVNCRSCGGDSFLAYNSTSYHTLGQRFSVSYGCGKVSGTLAQDTVSIGSLSSAQQAFGAVKSETEDFYDAPSDGLLGLAFGSIAQSKQPTFFENLMNTRQLASGAFAVHLQRDQPQGGEVCFGCFDTTKAMTPITWNPVVSRVSPPHSLNADKDADQGPRCRRTGPSISVTWPSTTIDTGTTLIYVPDSVASEFYQLVSSSSFYPGGFYTYPCDTALAVTLTFGGRAFGIDPTDFNLGRTSANSSDCVGGILALGQGFPDNLAIVGYSIYDYPGNRVGFALSINNR